MFSLIRRHLVFIVGMCLVGFFLGIGYTFYFDHGEKGATIFLTIGMQVSENTSADQYVTNESNNVIDQFTETIQGWFLNPAFQVRVNNRIGFDTSLSFRKQEKQNLVVNLVVPSLVDPTRAANELINELKNEIQAYDKATGSHFVLALSSITAYEKDSNIRLNILVALLLGFFSGILLVGLWEYFNRKVSFGFQVETILEKQPLYRLPNKRKENALKSFLDASLSAFTKPIILLELGDLGIFSQKKSLQADYNVHVRSYPLGLKDLPNEFSLILIVQLGYTSEDLLWNLKSLYGEQIYYVLII